MLLGIGVCETNDCTTCTCACGIKNGHACSECTFCSKNDAHTQK